MARLRTLKFTLAFVLICAVVYFSGVEDTIAVLTETNWYYFLYLIVIGLVMIWVSALKWRLFIRASGNDAPLSYLFQLYTAGYFFNLFAPSFIAGDIARSVHLGKKISTQSGAFSSTYLERLTGLIAMSMLGALSLLVGSPVTQGLELSIIAVAVLTTIISAVSYFKLKGFFKEFKNGWSLLGYSLFLSFCYHILTVYNTFIAARTIGWNTPDLSGLFIVVPLVLIVSMIPLTPSGLGVQEGAFMFLLNRIGATRSEALGVALILRAKVLLIGMFGAILWSLLKSEELKSDERKNRKDPNLTDSATSLN